MTPGRKRFFALVAAGVCVALATPSAFLLSGRSWRTGTSVKFYLQLGSAGAALIDGAASWDSIAADAIQKWNQKIGSIELTGQAATRAPLSGDGVNDVFFADDVFGDAFGEGVLAVTASLFRGDVTEETNVVFNRGRPWNSYRGPLRSGMNDFARVALHEFGHALGLQHPDDDGQSVQAIMNRLTSNIDDLQADDLQGVLAIYGAPPKPTLTLPARNETIDFRHALEAKYRDGLKRQARESFADINGIAAWMSEYIGYRVNGCPQAEAIARVFAQLEGRGVQPVCAAISSISLFPSASDSLSFRNQLETEYRDVLKTAATSYFVDAEGDATWVTEYVRLRLTGLDHTQATINVMAQVDVELAPGTPRGQLALSTTANQGYSAIEVSVNGRSIGTLRQAVEPDVPASCTAIPDTRLVTTVAAGTVAYSARTDTGAVWEGSVQLSAGTCQELRLECTNRNCAQ